MNKLSKSQSSKLNALPTKSAKIRFLTSLEWTRREIADELKIIYQFVRNVQITPVKNEKK